MLSLLQCHQTYFASIGGHVLGGELYDDVCKEFYLRRLLHCQNAFRTHLHAYRLMDRNVLLLFTAETPGGFSGYTDSLRRSYLEYFRIRFERNAQTPQSTTLVCRLPSHGLVRNAQKYIERFSQSANAGVHPGEYRHSSYCANAFSHRPRNLERHPAFRRLLSVGNDVLRNYRDFIAAPYSEAEERQLQLQIVGEPRKTFVSDRLEKSDTLTDIDRSGKISEPRKGSL